MTCSGNHRGKLLDVTHVSRSTMACAGTVDKHSCQWLNTSIAACPVVRYSQRLPAPTYPRALSVA